MKKIFDISLTINNHLPTWPGDTPLNLERRNHIEDGGQNVSRIQASVHVGTHIDAPCHFVSGARAVDDLPLDIFLGRAQVIEIPDAVDAISACVLSSQHIEEGIERVLFKTRNSKLWANGETQFQTKFVAILQDAAETLVQKGIRLVGIDYLSVAPYDDPSPTHVTLFKAGIIALEGLDLSQIPPGFYTLSCLPVKLGGSDGAPVRAVLLAE